ncbi:ABC transporter permease [Butyrivibrio sp. YAB3001]|uniref:ABC transporter permease n=1 Tax=Butyrivibrio sp. YAB3001 TaxID=1520812 RepID=UPI0008F66059|nr:ABC transporter permease [Butyrivibrio sp. YAB3001]SFC47966.1 peptide/nickel transport system permease protein [Butyrivibrio sp. YAB3001]
MMQVNKVLNNFEIVGTQYSKKDETQEARKPFIKGIPILSVVILVLIILGCLFCELIMTHDPSRMFLDEINRAPGSGHIFGTDTLGRDIWSMIWFGGRKSLIIGTVATVISSFIAVVYGTLSGVAGETVDNIMMRFTEILLSIPSILLVVFMQAALGQRNFLGISVIIGITSWMSIAKIVRAEVRKIRSEEYVLISKMMGGSFMHVLFKHLAPNFMSSIMFMIVMSVRSAIVSESTLSFLGIGLPVEIITWGSMLSLSEKALLTSSWWIILIPGIFLVVTLLCITDIGNYIRGSYNSKEGNL